MSPHDMTPHDMSHVGSSGLQPSGLNLGVLAPTALQPSGLNPGILAPTEEVLSCEEGEEEGESDLGRGFDEQPLIVCDCGGMELINIRVHQPEEFTLDSVKD